MFNSHIGPIAIFKYPEAPVAIGEKQPYLSGFHTGFLARGGGKNGALARQNLRCHAHF